MCVSPAALISPAGSMLFGGKKTRGALAGAALGGLPGLALGAKKGS